MTDFQTAARVCCPWSVLYKAPGRWTPLTIAYGYRFGNYKPSPVTVAALAKVMKAAGVPVPPEEKPVSGN
jgi:hypothetical protein